MKLEYDYNSLLNDKNGNNFMNFIITANQLKDWIEKDPDLSQHSNKIKATDTYIIINDLANRAKHFTRDDKGKLKAFSEPLTKDEFIKGFDWDDWDWDNFTWNPPEYEVEYQGKHVDLFEECSKIFMIYKNILVP